MMTSTSSPPSCSVELARASGETRLYPVIEKHELALLMLLGFAGFSALVGVAYNAIRRHVFKDFHNLDTVFDAGGRVTFSLTAVTTMSQLLWPADFLQSPTLASKVGIGGSLYYTLAIVLSILLFPVLCIQLKTRAPGAKTFPQIVYARFGKIAHIVYCIVALATNLVITANLILAGKAAMEVLAKGVSNEFVLLILAVLFGSYCMIGGLGTTFYISYFNTALIFVSTSIFILKVTYLAEPGMTEFASKASMYEAMKCVKGPEGNFGESLLTFKSKSGAIFGVVVLFMTIAIVFCDQANWQSRIAAKPKQGVMGFYVAGCLWFAIPTSVSFVSSMTYMALSLQNGTHLLSAEEIDAGYISPFVMETLLGPLGGYLLLIMLTMALMSTGSGEVMSVSSILVYDLYKTHINPFRKGIAPTHCVLCGLDKVPDLDNDGASNTCNCNTSPECKQCEADVTLKLSGESLYDSKYTCSVHGKLRHYEDRLLLYKAWCMIWVVICIIPYGLLLIETGINLNWAFMASQVFIAPFLLPLYLTISWSKTTGKGIVSGGLTGLVCSIVGMLAVGSTYDNGLGDFFTNTAEDYSLLAGLVSGFVVSSIVCVVVSLCTSKVKTDLDAQREWQKTMSIDNPLNPYRQVYKEELENIGAGRLITSKMMADIFKSSRYVSYIGGAVCLGLFLVVVPAVALSQDVLTFGQFSAWLSICQNWCLAGTFLVVIIPPFEESLQIYRKYRDNKLANENRAQTTVQEKYTEMASVNHHCPNPGV